MFNEVEIYPSAAIIYSADDWRFKYLQNHLDYVVRYSSLSDWISRNMNGSVKSNVELPANKCICCGKNMWQDMYLADSRTYCFMCVQLFVDSDELCTNANGVRLPAGEVGMTF